MSHETMMKTPVDLLRTLIACPSVNPGAMAGRDESQGGERRLAGLLEPMVRAWGAETVLDEWAPGRCNLLATWIGCNPRRILLLDAHMDTVGVEHMSVAPFEPCVRGGRLYGRGACDTKGPMAAMLFAIRSIIEEDGRPPVTICFAATGDEEAGAKGAARLAASGLRPDAAIIAEPTELRVIYAHKGACRFRVTLRGRAAHTSTPEAGVNAIEAAAEGIRAIRRDYIPLLKHQTHPELGRATVATTVVSGGQLVNIVPETCRFEVDCRCLPGERREDMEQGLAALLDRVQGEWPGLRMEQETFQWYPALEGTADAPFVTNMRDACSGVLGQVSADTVPYGTDGGFYGTHGVPCVVFGPGSIAQAHTADEYIELGQLAQAVRAYAAMIRAFR